jgi:hypothetical protein
LAAKVNGIAFEPTSFLPVSRHQNKKPGKTSGLLIIA